MIVRIEKIYEGRMGNTLRPVFEVYVDNVLVGFAERKWLARAIGDAIVAGHISATGDTTMRSGNASYITRPA